MKKLAIAIAVPLLIGAPAFAADLNKPVYKAPPPPPAPVYSWTGWYAGLNAGWIGANDPVNTNAAILQVPSCPSCVTDLAAVADNQFTNRSNGFIGGGQFGFNYQVTERFVAGFETDIQGTTPHWSASTSSTSVVLGPPFNQAWNSNTTVAQRLDYLGTVRGRIGVTATPNFLIYGTGGVAYGGIHSSSSQAFTYTANGNPTNVPLGFNSGSLSQTLLGWTVGGGLEWLFNSNWSAKLEYLHYDLGSATYPTGVYSFDTGPSNLPSGGVLSIATRTTEHFRGDVVRVGLNYQFH